MTEKKSSDEYLILSEFEEYVRQSEPGQKEKGEAWQTAIGLQAVDDLRPSDHLIETAKEHIAGNITIYEVRSRLDSYYEARSQKDKDRTEEADKVSARITEILTENTFTLSPIEYVSIHKRLFSGIYGFAGKIRDYNISKKEWILNGGSVIYTDAYIIRDTLDHDFKQEKEFSYKGYSKEQTAEHVARFVSNIWQVHAFGEGNTRTTAVFAIKYLRSLGFSVNNDMFANHSWYFRNALVRANYNDVKNNIAATPEYLYRFFDNLLLGGHNILSNRELLIRSHE